MSFKCAIYGLGIHVNYPLAALKSLPAAEKTDVYIEFGSIPADAQVTVGAEAEQFYLSPQRDLRGVPTVIAARLRSNGAVRMSYCDGTIFVINKQASQVWAITPPDQTVEDTAAYLLGPIMGTVLRMRGVMCLHGSAVAIGDQAVALIGVSGAGKSTTAAAFARLGYPVLSDDVLALTDLTNHFLVRPAYPRVRLWPESVAGLFGSADMLPRMTPNWDKHYLALNASDYHFQSEPLPLAAVYFLGQRTVGGGPSIVEAVRPTEALMALISDSYAASYIYETVRAKEFEVLSRLVQGVPLRRVAAVDDFAHIDELCHAIVQDLQTQQCTAVDDLVRDHVQH